MIIKMGIFADRRIKVLFYKIIITIIVFIVVSIVGIFYFEKCAAPESAAYFMEEKGRLESGSFLPVSFVVLCSMFCMLLTIIVILCRHFQEQNRLLENAVGQIRAYIAGNQEARIACHEEGELYRLFHEVNSLAAVLNAHTEKERKEKEFLKNTISDISHQLKTPLAALNIYNGILQGEAENLPTIQEFTTLSEQELDRIETLVQNLLKITKLDAGTIMMDKRSENMAGMMEAVKKHFAFRAEQEGKEIRLAGDKEVMLFCDRVWITEAVDNIVKNALDHTKEGGLVRIEWSESASAVRLVIKDNGSGIHPEDLYHIFKRFYRSRFSKDIQGIGLGLPLAKSIIEAHNGTIEVDSMEGVGTTFVITFSDKNVG